MCHVAWRNRYCSHVKLPGMIIPSITFRRASLRHFIAASQLVAHAFVLHRWDLALKFPPLASRNVVLVFCFCVATQQRYFQWTFLRYGVADILALRRVQATMWIHKSACISIVKFYCIFFNWIHLLHLLSLVVSFFQQSRSAWCLETDLIRVFGLAGIRKNERRAVLSAFAWNWRLTGIIVTYRRRLWRSVRDVDREIVPSVRPVNRNVEQSTVVDGDVALVYSKLRRIFSSIKARWDGRSFFSMKKGDGLQRRGFVSLAGDFLI